MIYLYIKWLNIQTQQVFMILKLSRNKTRFLLQIKSLIRMSVYLYIIIGNSVESSLGQRLQELVKYEKILLENLNALYLVKYLYLFTQDVANQTTKLLAFSFLVNKFSANIARCDKQFRDSPEIIFLYKHTKFTGS